MLSYIMYSILRYLIAKVSMRLGGDFDPNISCQTWQTVIPHADQRIDHYVEVQ